MKRVAIYARVSTTDQHTSNQVNALRDLVERHGAKLVAEYVDEGQSGVKRDRDALNAMLTGARKRQFDALYVVSICRLSRSVKNLLETVEILNDLGIEIVFQRENINTKTATGNFFLTVLGSLYELEREVMIERINAGIARAKSQGKSCGRPTKINDGLKNAIYLMYEKGVSIRDIAKTCTVGIGTVYKVVDAMQSKELQVA
jgi:DNA invertase Pin-like site-specific DNA recombinase